MVGAGAGEINRGERSPAWVAPSAGRSRVFRNRQGRARTLAAGFTRTDTCTQSKGTCQTVEEADLQRVLHIYNVETLYAAVAEGYVEWRTAWSRRSSGPNCPAPLPAPRRARAGPPPEAARSAEKTRTRVAGRSRGGIGAALAAPSVEHAAMVDPRAESTAACRRETMTDIRWLCSVTILLIVFVAASLWISGNGGWLLKQIRPTKEAEPMPPPDRYQTVEEYLAERGREFPALHETPPPAPVEGGGQLEEIYDYWPAGTDACTIAVSVKALRIVRSASPNLVAYLDVPINPELLAYLRSLSRGDRVTVAGIGHGAGPSTIYIYPVHRLNGREP